MHIFSLSRAIIWNFSEFLCLCPLPKTHLYVPSNGLRPPPIKNKKTNPINYVRGKITLSFHSPLEYYMTKSLFYKEMMREHVANNVGITEICQAVILKYYIYFSEFVIFMVKIIYIYIYKTCCGFLFQINTHFHT